MQPGGVYKVGFPRSDLRVTAGGVAVKPALALSGWIAFKQTGANEAMAMGDLVLTENESDCGTSPPTQSRDAYSAQLPYSVRVSCTAPRRVMMAHGSARSRSAYRRRTCQSMSRL